MPVGNVWLNRALMGLLTVLGAEARHLLNFEVKPSQHAEHINI